MSSSTIQPNNSRTSRASCTGPSKCVSVTVYRINLDQRHFPSLQEYEKRKLEVLNQDLSQSTADATKTRSNWRPQDSFMRSTTGKKLYF